METRGALSGPCGSLLRTRTRSTRIRSTCCASTCLSCHRCSTGACCSSTTTCACRTTSVSCTTSILSEVRRPPLMHTAPCWWRHAKCSSGMPLGGAFMCAPGDTPTRTRHSWAPSVAHQDMLSAPQPMRMRRTARMPTATRMSVAAPRVPLLRSSRSSRNSTLRSAA